MAGYIRQDTTGAISNNSIIEADDLNSEFNAVQGAFNALTGHKHDGTSAEGAPIEVVGPAQDVVITASTIRPKTDNAVDLGTSLLEFKDLYLDGTANIDNLVADAGTVAGSAITTAVNTQTLTNKTLTSPVINSADINTPDIDGGTIDGTVIGGTTPAAISGTAITASGNITGGGLISTGSATLNGGLSLNASTTETRSIEVGSGRTGDGNSLLDLVGDATFPDFGARFIRGSGANGITNIQTRGTGGIHLLVQEAGDIRLSTTNLERMRITSAGNVGIGTSTPAAKLHSSVSNSGAAGAGAVNLAGFFEGATSASVQISSGTGSPAFLFMGDAADIDATRIAAQDGFTQISASGASDFMRFDTGGFNERMRIDSSGNVGIGTSSPADKLDVNGSIITTGGTTNRRGMILGHQNNINSSFVGRSENGLVDAGNRIKFNYADNSLDVSVNSAERMRITSAGNVGIGTGSPAARLHVLGSTGNVFVGDNQQLLDPGTGNEGAIYFGANAANPTAGIEASWGGETTPQLHMGVTRDGRKVRYSAFFDNTLRMFTANLERMRINSAGSVTVGTTNSVIGGLTAQLLSEATASATNTAFAAYHATAVPGRSIASFFSNAGSTGAKVAEITTEGGGYFAGTVEAASMNITASTTENASMNIGLGRTGDGNSFLDLISDATFTDFGARFIRGPGVNANTNLQTRGTGALRLLTQDAAPIAFFTTNVERARIDESGNLLVGTTTAGPSNSISTSIEASGVNNSRIFVNHSTSGSSNGSLFMGFGYGGSTIGSITQLSTTSVAYNTSSDYRLKEDVQPMVGASERVLSLKPCNFAWKADGTRVDGFLAHEAQAVVPAAVTGEKDGEEMQAIDHSKLVPLLTAALQEALKEIADLKGRITALEA